MPTGAGFQPSTVPLIMLVLNDGLVALNLAKTVLICPGWVGW